MLEHLRRALISSTVKRGHSSSNLRDFRRQYNPLTPQLTRGGLTYVPTLSKKHSRCTQ